jgi:hypothetical protein
MEDLMDCFHRKPTYDTRTGRICAFCKQTDRDFARRNPLDQLVKDSDTAGGHITEEGYLRHRLAELKLLRLRADMSFLKTARQVA